MNFLSRFSARFFLRLGLGGTYLYSGFSLLRHPDGWYWALQTLPARIQDLIRPIGADAYLRGQGAAEFFLGAVFLSWFLPRPLVRAAAFLSAAQFLLILFLVGVSFETFRDLGLAGAAFALLVIP